MVGHSETGEMDKIDGPYYFFKLLQQLRDALPQWFPLAGPEGGQTNIVPVDFVAKAMDHIAHMPDDDLPGDTFHLVDPEPMTRRAGAERVRQGRPRAAVRDARGHEPDERDPEAGARRAQGAADRASGCASRCCSDLGIPPDAMENRDFRCTFDARDTQRALEGTGIAVPPLSSYAPASCGTTGSATSTRTSSASARSRTRSRARGS